MVEEGETVRFHQLHGVRPWDSEDLSSRRVWWNDAGVHQNITFPVHPDPVSGMHCWHQKVRVRRALPGDTYGDIHVDFAKARSVYAKWLSLARPADGELRRPIWLFRPVKPTLDAYRLPEAPTRGRVRRALDLTTPAQDALRRGLAVFQGGETGESDGDVEPGLSDARTSALDFAELVDWSPADVWGPLDTADADGTAGRPR
jgi:hypothetical protein